jgi:phospholipase/lecithinase/hemolysin
LTAALPVLVKLVGFIGVNFMATQWLRRAWLLAAGASALLLASCGGGSVVSQFSPGRIVAFGDGMADLGQAGARYTVNDGAINNWTQYIAESFGLTLEPSASGGLSYATGNARVTATPDAAGNAATPTVKDQIDTFLASGSFTGDDLVIVSAGTADVIVQAQAVIEGDISAAQAQLNTDQAARQLAAQVRRIVDAGAEHVLVVGPYNLGRSPWALDSGQGTLLERLSSKTPNTDVGQPRSFADAFKASMVGLGDNVLYVDAPLYFNNLTGDSGEFRVRNAAVCTSVDPGPGIGTGTNQVNSFLCTPSTVLAGANYQDYIFADRVYFTPRAQVLFGEYARDRLRDRW